MAYQYTGRAENAALAEAVKLHSERVRHSIRYIYKYNNTALWRVPNESNFHHDVI